MSNTDLMARQERIKLKVSNLLTKLPEESSTVKQLTNYLELYDDSSSYLIDNKHRLAFIGNIGAGKTTAICHILNLLDKDKPILSTGSGRTTLCEVNIYQSNELRIEIEAFSNEEVIDYLNDFSLYLISSKNKENKVKNTDAFKLSAEVERALRNMLDLKVSRGKDNNGKRFSKDAAKEFSSKYDSSEKLRKALIERIGLENRTKNVFIYDDEIDKNEWLHKTFKTINNATHSEVGLAKDIKIFTPQSLFNDLDYDLSVVDTKGVDQTVNRQDLDKCLTDDRTVSVICSRFNDAPDKTTVEILKNAKEAGLTDRIFGEIILLILDRNNEAEDVIDIDEAVGDKVEGREIRLDQLNNELQHSLQLESLDTHFLDAHTDSTKKLSKLLSAKVTLLRDNHKERLFEIEHAVNDIEKELISQSAKQAKKQVKETLEPWLKKAESCSPMLKEYFLTLISDIHDTGTYAASVRASVNRRGEWHNLNYYQSLAYGSRKQVVEQIDGIKEELIILIDNMLSQNDLQPAYALLKQLKHTANKHIGDMYQHVFSKGRAVYESNLYDDIDLWQRLSYEWGAGPGYKGRVAHGTQLWFQDNNYSMIESEVTDFVKNYWEIFIIESKELLGSSV